MSDSATVCLARKGEWLTASSNDEAVMMNVESGRIVGVNAMGARVWALLEQPRQLEWLHDTLLTEFDVSAEQCASEIDAFLSEMVKCGVIERR